MSKSAAQDKSAGEPSSGKTKPKWDERLSGTTAVVTIIATALGAIVSGFAISHYVFQPRAQLTAEINRVTVQQDVTLGYYAANTGGIENFPQKPPLNTRGVLVEIQAQLSGYRNRIYSGDLKILSPKTHVALTHITSGLFLCTQAVPSADEYSFVLECWTGEPVSHRRFIVRTRLYDSGLNVSNTPGYRPANPRYLAVLDTGVFTSTGR
jgi:hypothetical protein